MLVRMYDHVGDRFLIYVHFILVQEHLEQSITFSNVFLVDQYLYTHEVKF